MQSRSKSDQPGVIPPSPVTLARGSIKFACTTTPGANLPDSDKLTPGWFSNVNWSADWSSDGVGNNGWNPTSTLTTTADQSAIYTPDKDVPIVSGDGIPGGDPDLRKFVVNVAAQDVGGNHNFRFKLTFPDSVRVYENDNTKASAPITSPKIYNNVDLLGNSEGKYKVFYLEGLTASASFGDVPLTAEYLGGDIPMDCYTDTVDVTVFGVNQTGLFTGAQQADDPRLHSMTAPKGSKDENGQISWDLQKYIDLKTNTGIDYCVYFHDCMEMQGTVKPPRDANPSVYYGLATHADDPTIPEAPPPFPAPPPGLVTFEQHREAYIAAWKKVEGGEWTVKSLPNSYQARVWSDDWTNFTATQANIVTTASSGSHLYFIDNPGYDKKEHSIGLDYLLYYANLRNATYITFYGEKFQVSDWVRWHTKLDLIPKDANTLTRHPNTQSQDFGTGWIPVPTNVT